MITGLDLVLADHRRVERLFADFAATHDGTLVGQILEALTLHDMAEQGALYPLAAHLVDDAALLTRVFDAHSEVKTASEHLRALEGQPLVDAVEALRRSVAEHVADEEDNLLPALAAQATAVQLDGLAARFEQAKQRVG